MASAGRKDKLTEATKKKLLNAIKEGMPISHAPAYAGISFRTYYNWKQKGEATAGILLKNNSLSEEKINELENDKYFLFVQSLKKAESEFIMTNLKRIKTAKAGWQSSGWLLERRFPDLFGK